MMKRLWWMFGLLACSEDARMPMGEPMSGIDPYAQWAALETAAGCTPVDEELLTEFVDCEAEYSTWLTCVAQDLTQCHCESSDDDLNCEGSYRPSEGSALCIAEIVVAEECREEAEAASLNLRWQDLAGAAGCEVEQEAFWPADSPSHCGHLASEWLTCIASDASQCSCQAGVFHCDGSFDANLGPALCTEVHDRLQLCRE